MLEGLAKQRKFPNPRSNSDRTSCCPINPVAPVIKIGSLRLMMKSRSFSAISLTRDRSAVVSVIGGPIGIQAPSISERMTQDRLQPLHLVSLAKLDEFPWHAAFQASQHRQH